MFAFPFFWMLETRSTPMIVLAMIVGYGIGFTAMAGSQAAFLSELFETRYRYSGIAAARELNAMLVVVSGSRTRLWPLISGFRLRARTR